MSREHVILQFEGQNVLDPVSHPAFPQHMLHHVSAKINWHQMFRPENGLYIPTIKEPPRRIIVEVKLYADFLDTLPKGTHTLRIPDWIQGFPVVDIMVSNGYCDSCWPCTGFTVVSHDAESFVIEVLNDPVSEELTDRAPSPFAW